MANREPSWTGREEAWSWVWIVGVAAVILVLGSHRHPADSGPPPEAMTLAPAAPPTWQATEN